MHITLDQFLDKVEKRARAFQSVWKGGQERDPLLFPERMDTAMWWDNFEVFDENHPSLKGGE